MSRLVVDSSVAIKWFVSEDDSRDALRLRDRHQLVAPQLLIAECVNAFWKLARRGDLTADEAVLACQSLALTEVVLEDMTDLSAQAGMMAIAFDHPAYDCFFLVLAAAEGLPFVTADLGLVRKLRAGGFGETEVLTLAEAAALAA
jgi:predicted nucleic acid-binding protein